MRPPRQVAENSAVKVVHRRQTETRPPNQWRFICSQSTSRADSPGFRAKAPKLTTSHHSLNVRASGLERKCSASGAVAIPAFHPSRSRVFGEALVKRRVERVQRCRLHPRRPRKGKQNNQRRRRPNSAAPAGIFLNHRAPLNFSAAPPQGRSAQPTNKRDEIKRGEIAILPQPPK